MRPVPAIAAITLVAAITLALSSQASAATPATSYGRSLDEIELRLRFGIELGPAELEQDIAFTENLCLDARTAEAADETPAAEVDRHGLRYLVRHDDLGLTWMIGATLNGAERRVARLDRRFADTWRASPGKARVLRSGVGEVRGGEAAVTAASRPIRRGLVRVDSGMGLLWLLAEPAGPGA